MHNHPPSNKLYWTFRVLLLVFALSVIVTISSYFRRPPGPPQADIEQAKAAVRNSSDQLTDATMRLKTHRPPLIAANDPAMAASAYAGYIAQLSELASKLELAKLKLEQSQRELDKLLHPVQEQTKGVETWDVIKDALNLATGGAMLVIAFLALREQKESNKDSQAKQDKPHYPSSRPG